MSVDRSSAGFSVTAALQASRLGTSSLVFFAVAAAAPLTVVAGAVTTGYAEVGLVGLPAAYLVMTVVLLIWTVGYTALSRQVVAAGALYAYISRGLGPTAGITAAAIALVAYPLMHLGLLAGLGAILTQALATAGIQLPWLAGTLTAWTAIAVLGTRRIDLTGRLLAVLLIAEVTVMIGYDAILVTHPHGGHPQTGPLSPTQLLAPGGYPPGRRAANFTRSNCPRAGRRNRTPTPPDAPPAPPCITGTLTRSRGRRSSPDQIRQAPAGALLLLPSSATPGQTGQLLSDLHVRRALFHCTTRYLFAPRASAHQTGHGQPDGAPPRSSWPGHRLTAYTATGAHDPLKHLLLWGTITGGFGITALMAATSFAATTYLTRHPTTTGARANWWTRRLAPTTAGILLTTALTLSLSQLPTLFATTPTHPGPGPCPGSTSPPPPSP
jgi:hypothetical protein